LQCNELIGKAPKERKIKRLIRKIKNFAVRHVFKFVPRVWRFSVYRSFFKADQVLPDNLVLKIADTQEEIEASLALLHDAYVDSGFMEPQPSGMRVTIYHALPTTTTLCAKYNDKVVGTLSLIRDGSFGFPLQKIFDLTEVRAKKGEIAEVSALAVHPKFRRQGGIILFPLMKCMYEYSVTFFDVRHLVIAVNPRHIEMYESLLFFTRLRQNKVEHYDFVNGAPAVGATLDLHEALKTFKKVYGKKPPEKNLYDYFVRLRLPNIELPNRRFYTTNDPVMTPQLLDYFYNVRTDVFKNLDERARAKLHMIYDLEQYKAVLPEYAKTGTEKRLRHHARFSFKCPGRFSFGSQKASTRTETTIEVDEVSRQGFVARVQSLLTIDLWGDVEIRVGQHETSHASTYVVRQLSPGRYAFHMDTPDTVWRKFIAVITNASTKADLEHATVFMHVQDVPSL